MYEKLVDTLCAWMSRLWRLFFTTDRHEIPPTKLSSEWCKKVTDELRALLSEAGEK